MVAEVAEAACTTTAEDCWDSTDCCYWATTSHYRTNPNCVRRTTATFRSTAASARTRVDCVSSVRPLSRSLHCNRDVYTTVRGRRAKNENKTKIISIFQTHKNICVKKKKRKDDGFIQNV